MKMNVSVSNIIPSGMCHTGFRKNLLISFAHEINSSDTKDKKRPNCSTFIQVFSSHHLLRGDSFCNV